MTKGRHKLDPLPTRRDPTFSRDQIVNGSALAIENAVLTFYDALLLLKAERFPRAYALAVLALEEKGRHAILSAWAAEDPFVLRSTTGIRKELRDHVTKLRAAMSFVSFPTLAYAEIDETHDDLKRATIAADVLRAGDREAQSVLEHQPKQQHGRRLGALYVDAGGSGNWLTPKQLRPGEVVIQMLHVHSEIINALADLEREPTRQFASAVIGGVSLPTVQEFRQEGLAVLHSPDLNLHMIAEGKAMLASSRHQ